MKIAKEILVGKRGDCSLQYDLSRLGRECSSGLGGRQRFPTQQPV